MASQNQIRETVDHTTGETLRSERVYTARYKSEPFVSMSLPASELLHSLTSMKDMRVLLALAELAEFNTNAIFLIASRRQQVMARASVSTAQLSVALRRLREAGILSGSKGEAIIHPGVLWKGNSAVRREKLAELARQVKSNFENE
jgi:hypothetical protein